jgi:hypothetical protein
MTQDQKPPLLVWFLKGDKYLHEDSAKKHGTLMGIGVYLYVCVFVTNEFIWHFTPYTGMRAFNYLQRTPFFLFVVSCFILYVTRRVLFGANRTRPDPARYLPNRITVRLDYQNVIPSVGEKKWLLKRIAAYVDLYCGFILLIVLGWEFVHLISIPYFLLQKSN